MESCDEKFIPELSREELARYARHITLPEIGLAGQRRLKSARVLCIGLGGLGSPVTLYLAAAGVGTLGLVDADKVDLSNLQRQILHGAGDIGRRKLDSAADRLREINPHVALELHDCVFASANAEEIVRQYDIVIDGTDNFPTRYLSNDVCVFQRKPNIYGSIYRFEGQCTVFAPHLGGPCYRCMFPEPPPPGLVPSCAEGGVLGVLPGFVGVLQATEAIKIIAGIGEPLIGRLVHFDALLFRLKEFKLRRDPGCPVCGESPRITAPIDYGQFCGVPRPGDEPEPAEPLPAIGVRELARRLEQGPPVLLIDVREPDERAICSICEAEPIPLGELPDRLSEIGRDREIVVHCKSGKRSAKAARILLAAGFPNVRNLDGGIDAWAAQIDPEMPRY